MNGDVGRKMPTLDEDSFSRVSAFVQGLLGQTYEECEDVIDRVVDAIEGVGMAFIRLRDVPPSLATEIVEVIDLAVENGIIKPDVLGDMSQIRRLADNGKEAA